MGSTRKFIAENGPKRFGLTEEKVITLISGLPNAEKCDRFMQGKLRRETTGGWKNKRSKLDKN